jgi:hypothetical protein
MAEAGQFVRLEGSSKRFRIRQVLINPRTQEENALLDEVDGTGYATMLVPVERLLIEGGMRRPLRPPDEGVLSDDPDAEV